MRFESGPDATIRATDEALARAIDADVVILVEGISDQIALEVLAERLAIDLVAAATVVVPIGGAHAIRNIVEHFVPRPDIQLRGLVDAAEVDLFDAAGLDTIHVCDPDLEAELIRAIEPTALERLLEQEGDLAAFRTLQKQTGWRDRPFPEQMHRWLRAMSGRPNTYADRILRTIPVDAIPRPLADAVTQR